MTCNTAVPITNIAINNALAITKKGDRCMNHPIFLWWQLSREPPRITS